MTDSYDVLVLAAGKPHSGDTPSVLQQASVGRRVFDWMLDSYGTTASDVTFVAGFHAEEIRSRYPDLKILVNEAWENTGSLQSLLLADFDTGRPLFVNYGDVLVRRDTINRMNASDADVVIAIDSSEEGEDRKEARERLSLHDGAATRLGYDLAPEWADAEFVGVVRFTPAALARLAAYSDTFDLANGRTSLSEAVEFLRARGERIEVVDTHGQWVEVFDSRDIANFVLGTKADTLARLKGVLTSATIQDVGAFTVADWEADRSTVLEQIRAQFAGKADNLVVRSSARSEDTFYSSNAGGYDSVLNVDINSGLEDAIVQVIASYGAGESDDQVLVQPMLGGVRLSGVAFTRTLEHAAPYYVLNFDQSGLTDGVTSGTSKDHLTLHLRRGIDPQAVEIPELRDVVIAILEIEERLGYDALDIEFAVDTDGAVHIFQTRPIAAKANFEPFPDAAFAAAVEQAGVVWDKLAQSGPQLPGDHPQIYSVMTDWNPAEIIGTAPGKLAETLYRFLIMDETWATQRAAYGYRDVRPNPLLVTFAGRPYVDVRASFTSFIPAALSDDLAGRLLGHYSDQLRARPELHDKVEFDIIPTCLASDFDVWEERLATEGNFSADDIAQLRAALQDITMDAIDRCDADFAQIELLETRHAAIMAAKMEPLERARLLLENCRRYGTLPFAHLARSGFVAVTLLRGAETSGAITAQARTDFMSTIRTVSHEFTIDATNVASGALEWDAFVARYGHLRPGTYDITSPRYDADAERFLRPQVEAAAAAEATEAHDNAGVWTAERAGFMAALEAVGLTTTIEKVEKFLHQAIEGREYSKFVFTRSFSDAIEALAEAGEALGLTRDELASLPLSALMDMRDSATPVAEQVEALRALATQNDTQRSLTAAMKLPPVITKKQDLDSFVIGAELANFVGTAEIVSEFVDLDNTAVEDLPDVKGLIALIPQADPGYDWLFGQGILGLVTMYGGVNSHMAIRAAEFGMTAAIGIGEQRYRELASAKIIRLDPANQLLQVVS